MSKTVPQVIDDLERALGILGHGNAAAREYSVGRCKWKRALITELEQSAKFSRAVLTVFGNLDPESEPVPNSHGVDFP